MPGTTERVVGGAVCGREGVGRTGTALCGVGGCEEEQEAGRLRGEKQAGEDGETGSRQPHRQQVQCIVQQRALGRMVRLRWMKEREESKVVE